MSRIACVCAAVLGLAPAVCLPQAQYPAKPIRIVVGFPPGGTADILARVLAQKMTETWNQQVVVDNRPGANGIIGGDLTAKSTPDGHTLLLVSTSHTMNAAVNKLPFDAVKSFAPVATIGSGPLVLVTHPSFPASGVAASASAARPAPASATFISARSL